MMQIRGSSYSAYQCLPVLVQVKDVLVHVCYVMVTTLTYVHTYIHTHVTSQLLQTEIILAVLEY